MTKPHHVTTKIIHLALGWLCVGLAVIGAVLPLLPTTIFLILAAFFFTKGSPRLRAWLMAHPTFGPPIEDWERTGAIAPPIKRLALGMMALTLSASVVFGLPLKIIVIQALCMTAAALYILTRPSH